MIFGDARDGKHDLGQLLTVHGRLAAEGAEKFPRADQVEELRDVALGAGGRRERDVAEHLGHDAAEAEQDDRTEGWVALHADEELPAPRDHLLDEDGLEIVAGALPDALVGVRDFPGRAQAERNKPGLGLVMDGAADRLERDGAAEAGGKTDGVLFAARQAAARDGHVVRGEQLLGFPLVQRPSAGGDRVADERRPLLELLQRLRRHRAFLPGGSVVARRPHHQLTIW